MLHGSPVVLALASVLAVSLLSLVGVVTLPFRAERLQRFLVYLVSFAAGGLLGDAFLHLLPEAVEESGFTIQVSFAVLAGIVVAFTLEKFIHWHHHSVGDRDHAEEHVRASPFAIMVLFGDLIHNFVDGIIIAGTYLVSIPLGIATTIAVAAHEIPQEIADFGVLLHGGFSKGRALLLNFLSALGAVAGAGVAIAVGTASEAFLGLLVPFAVGSFVYVAGSDLIPELQKTKDPGRSALQLVSLLLGIAAMVGLLAFEG